MNEVPAWLMEYCIDARNLFGIGDEWSITISLADNPLGFSGNNYSGAITSNYAYLNCSIEFSRSIEEGEEAQRVVLHEFMHLALIDLTREAHRSISTLVKDKKDRKRALGYLEDAEERTIQRIVRGMSKVIRPIDKEDLGIDEEE